MRRLSEWRFVWCAIFAGTFLVTCVSHAVEPSEQSNVTRLEDYSDYLSIEKRLDEAYQEAMASASEQQRAILEDEHARWFLEREKLRNDPDIYIAYTQQEIRYFAGSYDEPSGVLTFDDLSSDEKNLYGRGFVIEMYEPKQPSRHYIDSVGIDAVAHKTKHGFKMEKKNLPPEPTLIIVFGKEDAAVARSEGRSMAESQYNGRMANQFLFAEGWDLYHDRFLTRAYVQEGMDAFNKALKQ
jgi:hypothetical protein